MKHIDRVTVWRRNKANEHKLLVIRSTWDASWVVVDYNPDVTPRKFAGWKSAITYARHVALARSIKRISWQAVSIASEANNHAVRALEEIGGDAA